MKRIFELIVLYFIKMYQVCVSKYIKFQCKYYPTCSEYAVLAIKKYGIYKGIIKSIHRIIRCNPCAKGGVDFP